MTATTRQPVRFATYPGRVDPVGEVMGPNTLGEYMTALTAEYDAATDTTRVGFGFTVREDVEL